MKKLSIYQQALVDAGLSLNQVLVYTYLIESGTKPASIIARRSGIPRTLTYRVLEEMQELKLLTRNKKKGAVATFTPTHPIKIIEIIEQKRRSVEQEAETVSSILNDLTSVYNKTLGQPGIASYEGSEGIETIYNDTLFSNKKKNVLVIRSHLDNDALGFDFYKKYIDLRAEKGISAQIITPRPISDDFPATDPVTLQERKSIPELKIPAEIDIYDNKVAIIAFEEPLIGTIIEKPAVAETMRIVFSYLWNQPDTTSSK